LRNAQRRQHKVNSTKAAALFKQHCCYNVTAYFRLQLLCPAPYFGAFLQNYVAVKTMKNYMRKSWSSLAPKMWLKLPPWASPWEPSYMLLHCPRNQGKHCNVSVTGIFYGMAVQFILPV
jgi:hypothetical protein